MTNPIIDALTWAPANSAASIRALQTALMALQIEWTAKLPQLGQISRDGHVTEEDWQGFDTERDDSTFLHFDNVNQEFEGLWENIYGEIQSSFSVLDSGKSEFLEITIIGNRVSIAGAATTDIVNETFTLQRAAKFFIYFPFLINRNSGADDITLVLKINTVTQLTLVVTPTTGSWMPFTMYWVSNEYAAGTAMTIEIEATIAAANTCEFADIAPLPNIIAATPLGIVQPYLGQIEVVYQ